MGSPGTALTFFPIIDAVRGRHGTGQVAVISFSIPTNSISYWAERLARLGLEFNGPVTRLGEELFSFADPDGLQLELIADVESHQGHPWVEGGVPDEHAIRGFSLATLAVANYNETARFLTDFLGFNQTGQEGNRFRFRLEGDAIGTKVDLLLLPQSPFGRNGSGTVHHIAWRTRDDSAQLRWREEIAAMGYNVTPVVDRNYFHSIYFREPGGTLFEIATDTPGFTVDETLEELGSGLVLPPRLEPRRSRLLEVLPPLQLPRKVVAA